MGGGGYLARRLLPLGNYWTAVGKGVRDGLYKGISGHGLVIVIQSQGMLGEGPQFVQSERMNGE